MSPCSNRSHAPRLHGTTWSCPDCITAAELAAEQAERDHAKAVAHIAADGVVTEAEWATFIGAVRQVAAAHAGVVDQNKVRPLIRGHIEPKHIGAAFSTAKRLGLLERIGINESTDAEGKNAGRPQPLYKLGAAA